jgi:hypothetical protein
MEYYILSLIITLIIFSIIQILDYRKKSEEYEYTHEEYSLFSINNCLLLGIIYIVITIALYLLYSSNINLGSYFNSKIKGGENNNSIGNIKEEINPSIISKIQDNFDIGLDPFNSDNSDNSDNSSISSTLSIDD